MVKESLARMGTSHVPAVDILARILPGALGLNAQIGVAAKPAMTATALGVRSDAVDLETLNLLECV